MSLNKPVVGISEAISILFIYISAKTFIFYGPPLIEAGMNAAWMIPLIQIAIGLGGVWLLAALLAKSSGRDLVQIGEELTGPYINTLFSFYYLIVIIFVAAIALRGTSERVVAGFLPDTPISLVVISFVMGSMIVSYLGLEAIVRTARFLVGILVLSMILLYVLTSPFWDLVSIYPLLGAGSHEIIKAALMNTGDFVEILLLGIIYPFIPQDKVRAIGIWGVLIAGTFMFLIVLVTILVFTYPTASELTLPSFELARIINIGRFGQRMEVVFLPIWVFANLILLSISFYAGAKILARMCKLKDYRPFVFSATVLSVVAAFVTQNVAQLAQMDQYFSLCSFGALIAILLTLYMAAWFKTKGGGQGEKGA
ncbi:GerAB/ArcD/ProY family transporter [Desulfoscipio sp. XC116]|uniref:GerAB/ArcD/ProY family transporter n=1 Tax=Desulfoscipio sp. XC116 TaxID=3144975 RepID=UPI00325BC842